MCEGREVLLQYVLPAYGRPGDFSTHVAEQLPLSVLDKLQYHPAPHGTAVAQQASAAQPSPMATAATQAASLTPTKRKVSGCRNSEFPVTKVAATTQGAPGYTAPSPLLPTSAGTTGVTAVDADADVAEPNGYAESLLQFNYGTPPVPEPAAGVAAVLMGSVVQLWQQEPQQHQSLQQGIEIALPVGPGGEGQQGVGDANDKPAQESLTNELEQLYHAAAGVKDEPSGSLGWLNDSGSSGPMSAETVGPVTAASLEASA